MDPYIATLIAASVSVLSAIATVALGPIFRARSELNRERLRDSERKLSRYSEPLVAAAYQLQNRLYYILQPEYRSMWPDIHRRQYIPISTAWLLAQYFGWIEVVRREVQILDLGEFARTAGLQAVIQEVAEVFATGTRPELDTFFAVYRAQQSAIGEVMIVTHQVAGEERADVMGYAEYCSRLESDSDFSVWMNPLVDDVTSMIDSPSTSTRGVLLQRALVNLVDFLDSERVRFPDVNERGRLPSLLVPDWRPRAFPPEVARFRNHAAIPIQAHWAGWVERLQLENSHMQDSDGVELRARLSRRLLQRRRTVVVRIRGVEVLILLYLTGQLHLESTETTESFQWSDARRAPSSQLRQLNSLLENWGGPVLSTSKNHPLK